MSLSRLSRLNYSHTIFTPLCLSHKLYLHYTIVSKSWIKNNWRRTLYVCFCYTLYVRNSKSLKLEKFEVGKDRSRPCEYHYKIYVDFQKHLPMMQILRLFYMKRYRHVYISDKKPCLSFQKQLYKSTAICENHYSLQGSRLSCP